MVSWAWLAYGLLWTWLALAPHDRVAWLLENVLVGLFIGLLFAFRRRLVLSPVTSLQLVAFLSLHAIGSHYTYSEVPYDRWVEAVSGRGLNARFGWERNHFDRLVHFMGGALLVNPIRELWLARYDLRAWASRTVPLAFVMAGSLAYELLEWAAALVFGGELGAAYLGTQGDVWDAQKDMALAGCGGLTGLVAARIAGQDGRTNVPRMPR